MTVSATWDVIDIGQETELSFDESEYEAGALATIAITRTPAENAPSILRAIRNEYETIVKEGTIDQRRKIMRNMISGRKYSLWLHKHGPTGRYRLTGEIEDEQWTLYEAGMVLRKPPLAKIHSIAIGSRIGDHVEGIPLPERKITSVRNQDGDLGITMEECPWVPGIPLNI